MFFFYLVGQSTDAPRIRQSDISFALTVIFQALDPPQPRPATAGSSKSVASGGGAGGVGVGVGVEAKSGSLSLQGSTDHKIRTRPTLDQVAFLGLKILMTCFSHQVLVAFESSSSSFSLYRFVHSENLHSL